MSKISRRFLILDTTSNGLNAQVIPANFSPANYTPVQVGTEGNSQVSSNLKGIDNALATKATPAIVQSKSTTFTATNNVIYLVNTSGGALNVQLPSPTSGTVFYIKDSSGSAFANNITLLQSSTESIDGTAASYILNSNWGSWTVVSDGINWFIL